MKKVIKQSALMLSFVVIAMHAQAQEVQPVVDITPDKAQDVMAMESKRLTLPTPPAEIKTADIAADLKTTSTRTTGMARTPKMAKAKAAKTTVVTKTKPFAEMTQQEQIAYLEHKIQKLREKSHKTNARFHTLEKQIARLQQELGDLKESLQENRSSNQTQGEL